MSSTGFRHSLEATAQLLVSGYSCHERVFRVTQPEGLQSYLMRLQTEGVARVLVNGEMTIVKSGDLALYSPGSPYMLETNFESADTSEPSVPCSDYYLFCRGQWMDEWWNLRRRPPVIRVTDESIVNVWRQIVIEQQRAADADDQITDLLLRSLCLMIDRNLAQLDLPKAGPHAFIALRMKHYVERRAATPFTLGDVAAHVGLSTSRAAHLFKATFGLTVVDYAQEVRLKMACERILYSSMTLEQAAESAGFGSYSYFSRVFRKKHGCSPSEYRTRHLTT